MHRLGIWKKKIQIELMFGKCNRKGKKKAYSNCFLVVLFFYFPNKKREDRLTLHLFIIP
jgi:hypothetical protein